MKTPLIDYGHWITSWSEIWSDQKYLVCVINERPDKTLYLGQPVETLLGWEVMRLTKGCYAALPIPEWRGVSDGESRS